MEENRKLLAQLEQVVNAAKYEVLQFNEHMKEVLVDIPPERQQEFQEDKWLFAADHWEEIHQVVTDVVEKTKKLVGHARVLIWPAEVNGVEWLYGMLYTGTLVTTIPAPLPRILKVMDGVLKVTNGSDIIMDQVRKMNQERAGSEGNDNKYYRGQELYIPAGDVATYEVVHNVLYVSKFFLKQPEYETGIY